MCRVRPEEKIPRSRTHTDLWYATDAYVPTAPITNDARLPGRSSSGDPHRAPTIVCGRVDVRHRRNIAAVLSTGRRENAYMRVARIRRVCSAPFGRGPRYVMTDGDRHDRLRTSCSQAETKRSTPSIISRSVGGVASAATRTYSYFAVPTNGARWNVISPPTHTGGVVEEKNGRARAQISKWRGHAATDKRYQNILVRRAFRAGINMPSDCFYSRHLARPAPHRQSCSCNAGMSLGIPTSSVLKRIETIYKIFVL